MAQKRVREFLQASSEFSRIQSPSSINTYNLCKRRYYYKYIRELPDKPSIHTVRGKAAHLALENLFKIDISKLSKENWKYEIKMILMDQFNTSWNSFNKDIETLELRPGEISHYYDDTLRMLEKWFNSFSEKIDADIPKLGLEGSFKKWAPETEIWFVSHSHGVQGYVDAIHNVDQKIILIDYKTSANHSITKENKLQLAIYALLYNENKKKMPNKVGISFLGGKEKILDVDEELIDLAVKEIEKIHSGTKTKEMIDFPVNVGPWCKWSSGECSFYETCLKER